MAIISDNFNRADNTDINANNPHPSWVWAPDFSTSFEILSNRLNASALGAALFLRAEIDLDSADHVAQWDVRSDADNAFTNFGPMVRMPSTSYSGFLTRVTRDGTATVLLRVYRVDSTALTQLGADVDITADYVDGLPVKLEATGADTLKAYYNGVLKATRNDSAYNTNRRVGARAFRGGGGAVIVWGDNFTAQDVGAVAQAGSLVNSSPLKSLVDGGLVS